MNRQSKNHQQLLQEQAQAQAQAEKSDKNQTNSPVAVQQQQQQQQQQVSFDSFRNMLQESGNKYNHGKSSSDGKNGDNKNNNKSDCSTSNTLTAKTTNLAGIVFRIILFDGPLCALLIVFCIMHTVVTVHDRYYIPLMDRTVRTNDMLLDEYTYYDRQCTEYDITTHSLSDMLLNYSSSSTSSTSTSPSSSNTNTANILPENQQTKVIIDKAVDQMLLHGGVVIPNVLRTETVKELRSYIVHKNKNIDASEKYPVSQGKKRLSYGIDASEHSSVSNAIKEIICGYNETSFVVPARSRSSNNNSSNNSSNHSKGKYAKSIVRLLLEELLGDPDPASAEITAITSYYGAIEQVWHMDTKIDGNAVKYARTYSHSYSLFLPLQETTIKMGATDVCPGSHMCANDMESICERNKVSLHHRKHATSATNITATTTTTTARTDTTPTLQFQPGDAALLNQHVWHRGGQHNDPTPDHERIVFVVSFVARPTFFHGITTGTRIGAGGSGHDTRQLSRGTYFHQKWNMWGHTMNDLIEPTLYMKKPFSILRCLRLWKPPLANWGYDLITATYMRFMNGQLEDSDFEERFIPRLDSIGFPSWLRGRLDGGYGGDEDEDEESKSGSSQQQQSTVWKVFIKETIGIMYMFTKVVLITSHVAFVLVLLSAMFFGTILKSTSNAMGRFARQSMKRIVLTHTMILLIFYKVLHDIEVSEWGKSIDSGIALMRPFPPVRIGRTTMTLPYQMNERKIPTRRTSAMEKIAPLACTGCTTGRTTSPTRNDVLVGTRYDGQFLGSYNRWLQYHPGNAKFLRNILPDKLHAYRWYYDHGPQQQVHGHDSRTLVNSHSTITNNTSSAAMRKDFQRSNPAFVAHIVQEIVHEVQNNYGGRFLQQDYRNGDWRIMSEYDSNLFVFEEMALAVAPEEVSQLLIRTGINYQIAHWRFGNSLSQRTFLCPLLQESSHYLLSKMKRKLLRFDDRSTTGETISTLLKAISSSKTKASPNGTSLSFGAFKRTQKIEDFKIIYRRKNVINHMRRNTPLVSLENVPKVSFWERPSPKCPLHSIGKQIQRSAKYRIGSQVWYYFDRWYTGTVIAIEQNETSTTKKAENTHSISYGSDSAVDEDAGLLFTVSFDDGTTETNLQSKFMAPYLPITEGDTVEGCFNYDGEPLGDCYPGLVVRVMAGGEISIMYADDGEVEWIVPPGRYYQPPYKK